MTTKKDFSEEVEKWGFSDTNVELEFIRIMFSLKVNEILVITKILK